MSDNRCAVARRAGGSGDERCPALLTELRTRTSLAETHHLMTDADGYGARPGQTPLERLLEDSRTLSPAGIERVARGWDHRSGEIEFHEAEHAALQAIEQTGRVTEWDLLRNQLLGLTERGQPLVAWRIEHEIVGHKAEDALLAAALAVTAGEELDAAHRAVLVRPMSEALPWLGGDTP